MDAFSSEMSPDTITRKVILGSGTIQRARTGWWPKPNSRHEHLSYRSSQFVTKEKVPKIFVTRAVTAPTFLWCGQEPPNKLVVRRALREVQSKPTTWMLPTLDNPTAVMVINIDTQTNILQPRRGKSDGYVER
jgi:hypothetical protein